MKITYYSLILAFSILARPSFAQSDTTDISADSLAIALDSLSILDSLHKAFSQLELKTDVDSISYSFGVTARMTRSMSNIDHMMFLRGYFDNHFDTVLVNKGKSSEYLREKYRRQRLARRNNNRPVAIPPPPAPPQINHDEMEKLKQKHSIEIAIGEKFLKKNAKRASVTTTESGLQYEVVVGGSGAKPSTTSQVQIFYRCTDIYGKTLKESKVLYNVSIQSTIKAWQEGLPKIPVGATYKFYVPPHLAYSYKGAKDILPFQTVIYTIELSKIVE